MTWILNIFPKYIVIIHATDKTHILRKLTEIMVNFLLLASEPRACMILMLRIMVAARLESLDFILVKLCGNTT